MASAKKLPLFAPLAALFSCAAFFLPASCALALCVLGLLSLVAAVVFGKKPFPVLVVAAGMGIVLGTVLGLCSSARLTPAGVRGGFCANLPYTALIGKVAAMPVLSASGMLSIVLDVSELWGPDGLRASASGRVTVCARTNLPVVRGQSLQLNDLQQADGNPALWFAGDNPVITRAAPRLERIRATVLGAMLAAIDRAGGRASGLLKALLLGCRDDLNQEDAAMFRDAGCAHILALSGQHVVVIAWILRCVLGAAFGKRIATTASCVVLVAYAWICGASPSVVRAVLMFCLSALFSAADRPQHALAVLSWAWILSMTMDPQGSASLSAQLSYLAALGISL
ncbi:MAG TPA: ComEC/Rec2 family competence protein, partial [Spirochaetales bacterium]|nr:ComEC/Rec2 family competence protein [Spirochaetales bacterium]